MKMNRPGLTKEAIILWKKKNRLQSIFSFVTETGEVFTGSILNSRLNTMKDGGYLQPFGHAFVTIVEGNNYYSIQQVDGVSVLRQAQQDLLSITYLAYGGELIYKLFQQAGADERLFSTLKAFVGAMRHKPIPLGVVILGWQIMHLAGFVPSGEEMRTPSVAASFSQELYETTEIRLSPKGLEEVQQILLYDWSDTLQLTIARTVWAELEKALFSYSTVQLGDMLESLRFMNTLNSDLLQ